MNAKLDLMISIRIHSEASRTEQSLPKYSGIEFDCGDHRDNYVTPPTLIKDSKEKKKMDESVLKITFPKPWPL